MQAPPSGLLAPLTAALLALSAAVAAAFAVLAPEPYMDEPFHVPQTQRYCAGRWREWDPKITTFPGLYLFGAALGRLVHAIQHLVLRLHVHPAAPPPQLCGTTALRAVNPLFAAACVPVFYHTAQRLDAQRTPSQLLLMTAACALFPLHFFFSFLYYTDVPSVLFTLAAYLAALQRRRRLAGALGALAVLMRQTNAVWVAFILGSTALNMCLDDAALPASDRQRSRRSIRSQSGRSIRSSSSSSSSWRGHPSAAPLTQLPAEVGPLLLRQAWRLKQQLLLQLWPLAGVVAAFAAFVAANGSIVVGDKQHHAPVRHLAQPLYFLAYSTAWLAPAFWAPGPLLAAARQLACALRRSPVLAAGLLAAGGAAAAAAVRAGSLVHPFLLADNRHYTFYLWRRLVNCTPWARYAAIPAYLYSAAAMQGRLAHRRPTWQLLFAGAACAVLVPAHLVEFRYFTAPFLLFFLHMRTPSPRTLTALVGMFAAANAATLYAFLCRPFAWPDGSVARFIW